MKLNLHSNNCLKLWLAIVAMVISISAIAQTRPQVNIRRVTVTFQYVIENGKRTDKVWPIYQELFDSLGRCHTEIDYDNPEHNSLNYCWNSFSGKLKTKSEFFLNDKLNSIEEFSYNKDSLVEKKTVKRVSPTDTAIYLTYTYKYDPNRNLIETSAKTLEGKTAFVSKSTFDTKGRELTRKVKVKKTFYPKDSILKLQVIPVYDSIGRLASEQLTISKAGKPVQKKVVKYKYDKKNNPVGVLTLDVNGKQTSREERDYQYSRNRLSMIKYFNANDVFVNMITKRYEIYTKTERKERVIDY